jgi:hypothetical protein
MKTLLLLAFAFLANITIVFSQYYFDHSQNLTKGLDYRGNAVSYMPNGDYVISGMVVDTIKLSPTVELVKNGTNSDCYVAWYKSDGSLKWHIRSKTITGSSSISENGIKTDKDYNIYLVGSFSGKKYFSSSFWVSSYGYADAYCLKIDSSGTLQHLMHIADSEGYAQAIDKDGNVIIGGKGNNSSGKKQAFMAKFDRNGNFIKSVYFLGTNSNRDYIYCLDVDKNNNIYFTGHFNSSSLGLQSLPKLSGTGNVNNFDFFVGQMNDTLAANWLKGSFTLSTKYPSYFALYDVVVDTISDLLYMGGYYSGNFSVENDTMLYYLYYTKPTPVLIKMDLNGNYKWKSLLGFVNQNNYGYVYDLLLNSNNLWALVSVTNTSLSKLKLGNVNYDSKDKGLLICSIDTMGNVLSGFGTEPDSAFDIIGRSFTYSAHAGFAVGFFQNHKDPVYFGNEKISTGSSLVFTKECSIQKTKLIYSKTHICQGDSTEVLVQNINAPVHWYKDGNPLTNSTNKLYVSSSGSYSMSAEDANACPIQSDTVEITVHALPVVSFSGLTSDYCVNDSVAILKGNPAGGTFSGSGISGNSFDPSIGVSGTRTISYIFTDSNGCSNNSNQNTIIHELPVVSFSGLDTIYCMDAAKVNLSGSPAGGSFTGTGINGNSFDPAQAGSGVHTISYYYQDAFGCENTNTQQTKIYDLPLVSFSGLDSAYCPDAAAVVLTGVPAGGLFSGNGISSNTFDPAMAGTGYHTITYTYTDIHTCSNSANQVVRVKFPSECGSFIAENAEDPVIIIYPNPASSKISVLGIDDLSDYTIFIIDVMGRKYLLEPEASNSISLTGFAKGVYVLKFRRKGTIITAPIVIN